MWSKRILLLFTPKSNHVKWFKNALFCLNSRKKILLHLILVLPALNVYSNWLVKAVNTCAPIELRCGAHMGNTSSNPACVILSCHLIISPFFPKFYIFNISIILKIICTAVRTDLWVTWGCGTFCRCQAGGGDARNRSLGGKGRSWVYEGRTVSEGRTYNTRLPTDKLLMHL